MMEVMRGYVTSKIIQPDDRLEKRVRDDLNLPDIDDTSIRDINETPDYKEDQDDQDKENPDKQKKPAESPDEGK